MLALVATPPRVALFRISKTLTPMSPTKRTALLIAAAILLVVLAIFWPGQKSAEPSPTPDTAKQTPPSTSAAAASGNTGTVAPPAGNAVPTPAPTGTARPAVAPEDIDPVLREKIETAVVTYSPEALPAFKELLASPDREVRAAAIDGLLRLGENGGAALLREAAGRTTNEKEIEEMEAAAEYLELPPRVGGLRKQKSE
jgi:hypothetical protein